MPEIISGAVIAAVILLVSSLVTLFSQDPGMTFQQISQGTWVSMIGGALVAFLKDFQSISTRKLVSKLTGRPEYVLAKKPDDPPSPDTDL
jgi:hypothetical protein